MREMVVTNELRASGRALKKLARDYEQLLESLGWLMRAHDLATYHHSVSVSEIAQTIARQMGFPDAEVDTLAQAGFIHDVGKVALPQAVLQKPGRLTEHERELVQRHPEIGCTMLERWECVRQLLPAVRHHHEWYDGSGYPDGLAGDQIPMSARILAVADSYDA